MLKGQSLPVYRHVLPEGAVKDYAGCYAHNRRPGTLGADGYGAVFACVEFRGFILIGSTCTSGFVLFERRGKDQTRDPCSCPGRRACALRAVVLEVDSDD